MSSLKKYNNQDFYIIGPTGPTGPQGASGGKLNYADFYALMTPDKYATVAPGTDVSSHKMDLIVE